MQLEFGLTPYGLWNIMEFILTALFFTQFLYFFHKYRKEKKNGAMSSVCQFDLVYAIFFLATTINQIFYIMDTIKDLAPKFDFFISNGDMLIYLGSIEISLSNQNIQMLVLLFLALSPAMYPIEKYLQNKSKPLIFYLACIATILLMCLYLGVFVIGRALAQPDGFNGEILVFSGENTTMLGKVMNILLLTIALYTILVALIVILNFIFFYLILAIKTTGPLRTKALLIFIGFLLFYGALIIGNGLKSKFDDPDEFLGGWLMLGGPIAFLIGNAILFLGFNKKVMN